MNQVILQPQLVKMLGISRSTLHKLRVNNEIPAPRVISSRCVGWLQSEIDEWLESRPRATGFSDFCDS
ncbi:helix-turn-helix transcriptional regulator [Pseudidiomarina salinarum]|uniref:helix-turn-helix transcriptional regulator n=1 Tax=Pseudidiomarina salinarum TaxID=435908 RepID=UPI000A0114E3|nr:AlpA family phage regulatory protein [Pseudidiomarina salinarum]